MTTEVTTTPTTTEATTTPTTTEATTTPTTTEATTTPTTTEATTTPTTTEATTTPTTTEAITTPTTTEATTTPTTTEAITTPTTTEATTATPPTTTTAVKLLECENGWSLYRESCYRLSDFPHAFGAQDPGTADCASRGAHPVTVSDAGENAFVSALHQDFVARSSYDLEWVQLFIDLQRNSSTGTFGWPDGTPFGPEFYSNWAPGQPNNAGGTEDCVEMNHVGMWNDIPCNSLRMWMCEKSAIVERPKCENGWSLYRESCYRLSDFPFGFGTLVPGADDCASRGAHPVSISDTGENAFVSGLQQNSAASGGYDLDWAQLFIDLRRNSTSGAFGWHDGTPFGPEFYSNWAPGQPNNADGAENCVEMNHAGMWNDIPCSSLRKWMCEKSAIIEQSTTPTTTDTPTTPPATESTIALVTTETTTTMASTASPTTTTTATSFFCEDGWSPYQESCYRIGGPFGFFSMDPGSADCASRGALPVSIEDAGENTFVSEMQQHFIATRGSCSVLDRCQLYIGLRRSSGNPFEWLDGTPFGPALYSNWAPAEPNNATGSEHCVEMNSANGLWYDVPCHFVRIWMCEKPASTVQSTASTTTESTTTSPTTEPSTAPTTAAATVSYFNCEVGWSLHQMSCYRLLDRAVSFDTGTADCEGRGGHPVSITDAGENAFVNQLYLNNRPPPIDCSAHGRDPCQVMYIGLRRNHLDQFKMVDGTEWDNCCGFYANWAPGEDSSSVEKCAAMRDDGKWADVVCDFDDHDHHFLMCEKPASTTSTTTQSTSTPTTESSTTTTTTTTKPPTFACQDLWGWHLYQQSCYKLHERVTSFDAGRAQCQGQGAVPVTIGDAGENAFINQLHLNTRHTFLCDRGDGACQVMYIGLRRNSAGNFGWFDGTPFGAGSYVNWALGEPKSAGTEPCTGTNGCNNCVEMNLDGTWNNIQCDYNDAVFEHDWHSIMCEKPAHTSWIPGQSE